MFLKLEKNRLEIVREKEISEKEIQKIIGENLEILLNLKFVSFEFSLENVRIDILAFDAETNAPVILELKKDNSKALFDQGMEYFNILSNRKNDFLVELLAKKILKNHDEKVNWENSRVIFIGKNFSLRQRRAVDFKGIPIELFDYDFFENNFLKFEQIGLEKSAKLEIPNLKKSSKIQKIQNEFVEFDRDFHREKASEKTWEIFEKIENEILNWGNVSEKFNKICVDFKIEKRSFASIIIQKENLKITFGKFEKQKFASENFKIRNLVFPKKIGKSGNGDFEIKIPDDENLDELFLILKKCFRFLEKK